MSEEEIYNYLISFVSSKIKQHKLILQDMAGFNLGYLLTEDLQKAVQGLMDLRKTEQEKNVELRTITMTFDNLFGRNFISKDKIKEAIENSVCSYDCLRENIEILLYGEEYFK